MARRASRLPLLLIFLLLFCLTQTIRSQQTADKTAPQTKAVDNSAKSSARVKANSAAAKARLEQQRALALSLLVSLANEARSYPDQKLRARTLSRIADAFWDPDPEQGRALFRKAWDAAEIGDQESARRTEEERQRQKAEGGSYAVATPPDLRSEVLRLAAKRDRALGEELLDKLKEARKQSTDDAGSSARPDTFDAASLKQRLRLANQLLETDVERALQFADPALATVSMEGLNFLSSLRDKNPAAADLRYSRMLAVAETNLQSDANTISLLSSYLFTPHLFVTFSPTGGQNSSQMNMRTTAPDVTPELRNAFFRVAAQILLRPSPSREQDWSTSGIQGKYLVIKRLMPLFEQYGSKETLEQLRGELASLGHSTVRSARDEEDDDWLARGITPGRKSEDVEKSLLDRIERAKTAADRDTLYLELATRTAEKGDMRARDFTEKIDDSELRKRVKPYVDMTLAINFVEKKDVEKALNLATVGELSHVQRVWLLTQAGKILAQTDREKALGIIADAGTEARRIAVSDPDRPRALVAVANALLTPDRARAWDTMLEVTKASNSSEGFNGEDGRLTMHLQSKSMNSMRTSTVEDFNLNGIFRTLSQENASQAIEIARSFEDEAPRATALISVARALLSDKER